MNNNFKGLTDVILRGLKADMNLILYKSVLNPIFSDHGSDTSITDHF